MNPIEKMIKFACLSVLASALSACTQSSTSGSLGSSDSSYSAPNVLLVVCSGYGCILKDRFGFTIEEQQRLQTIMNKGQSSPINERKALQTAISEMEQMAQRHLRYRPDVAFSYQKNAGKRGQMDCIDESLNTTNYLKYLQAKGLLRHHTPHRSYAERGLIIDGRYPHKSARIRDENGTDWAVDSWKGNDGSKPEIMLLAKWYKDRNNASNY